MKIQLNYANYRPIIFIFKTNFNGSLSLDIGSRLVVYGEVYGSMPIIFCFLFSCCFGQYLFGQ